MKRLQCPCCGYYTVVEDFDYCDVCMWQYDSVSHNKPDISFGANHISLNDAKENYKKHGICKLQHIGKGFTRPPLPEELPENNA